MPDIFNASEYENDQPEADREVNSDSESGSDSSSSHKKPLARNMDQPHRDANDYSEVLRKEVCSTNPFDAFAPKPMNVSFDAQDKAERVLLLLRRHPVTQVKWVLGAILMLFLPFLFSSIDILFFFPGRFQFAGLVIWYLLITGFVLESLLTWFFNVYIITDERVIDVDFLSLIYKNITAAKIDNIEDVTIETGGALKALLNYGDVKIQTASSQSEIEFEDIPQPAKVTRLLNELILEEEREKIEGRVN